MSLVLNKPALVLNKSWVPINIESAQEAITKAFSGIARAIDESYILYSWNEWIIAYSDPGACPEGDFIQAVSRMVRVPSVIVLNTYNRIPKTSVKLTRRNLLIRDKFTCAYCGKKVTMKTATMDHVVPRSKSGISEWKNLVVACFRCNIEKSDKTLQQCGKKLLHVPRKPIWSPIFTRIVENRPKLWDKFIDTEKWNEIGYWDVELKE